MPGLSTAEESWKRQEHRPRDTGLAAGEEAQEGIRLFTLMYEEDGYPNNRS